MSLPAVPSSLSNLGVLIAPGLLNTVLQSVSKVLAINHNTKKVDRHLMYMCVAVDKI